VEWDGDGAVCVCVCGGGGGNRSGWLALDQWGAHHGSARHLQLVSQSCRVLHLVLKRGDLTLHPLQLGF
jgi:hypothetical protein